MRFQLDTSPNISRRQCHLIRTQLNPKTMLWIPQLHLSVMGPTVREKEPLHRTQYCDSSISAFLALTRNKVELVNSSTFSFLLSSLLQL